jgi:hypothetical protein
MAEALLPIEKFCLFAPKGREFWRLWPRLGCLAFVSCSRAALNCRLAPWMGLLDGADRFVDLIFTVGLNTIHHAAFAAAPSDLNAHPVGLGPGGKNAQGFVA